MKNSNRREPRPLRYRVDRLVRSTVMLVIGWLAPKDRPQILKSGDSLKRVLLVRTNYRIGNAILTLPAIQAFRARYPGAEIDFVGAPIARVLFENQSLNHFYDAPRRFPGVVWKFPLLLRRLRARHYDLAVEVSCSQSGIGAFVVGFSGARIRAGCAGKWDHLLNLKVAKLRETNKYSKLVEFLSAIGLENAPAVGSLKFTELEAAGGSVRFDALATSKRSLTVGVFIGARKLRGKRWPLENFIALIGALQRSGYHVVTFLGPDESDMADSLKTQLQAGSAIVSEPSIRKFAAIVANLDLFICCDSGPMHLACSVGVPVLAIFQQRDVARWAPPSTVARALYADGEVSEGVVLQAALEELSKRELATKYRSGCAEHSDTTSQVIDTSAPARPGLAQGGLKPS